MTDDRVISNYKTVASLSDIDAAYIAGLIDGEGTVTLSRRHRNEMRQLVISISNTDFQLLDYVLRTVGAGKITRKRTTADQRTPSATYAVSNRQALDLLRQVAPYLKTYKRDRADLGLNQYIAVTPRNGKYTAQQREARSQFETAFLTIKPQRTIA